MVLLPSSPHRSYPLWRCTTAAKYLAFMAKSPVTSLCTEWTDFHSLYKTNSVVVSCRVLNWSICAPRWKWQTIHLFTYFSESLFTFPNSTTNCWTVINTKSSKQETRSHIQDCALGRRKATLSVFCEGHFSNTKTHFFLLSLVGKCQWNPGHSFPSRLFTPRHQVNTRHGYPQRIVKGDGSVCFFCEGKQVRAGKLEILPQRPT